MFLTQTTEFLYQKIAKPLFFLINPETMHTGFWFFGHLLWKLRITRRITRKRFHYSNPVLAQTIAWITFWNPVWLAAWFDKDVQLCHIISDVWFWFTEIGSITAEAYAWNPAPRLYRLIQSQGLIVYYGLKNNWIDWAIKKYKSYNNIQIPVVISLAKTNCQRTTDTEAWKNDYLVSLDKCIDANVGDIIELNISCPNAFGGENFAHPDNLKALLSEVKQRPVQKPLFIKMPVDCEREELKELIDICIHFNVTGIVISNLTKKREHIAEKDEITHLHWWISWKPTVQKSNELIWKAYQYCKWKLIIIGVWWIFTAEDAYEKIRQWATLLQLITWMIFQWPQRIGQINQWLVELMKKDWYDHISQVIWSAHFTTPQ
jgi:dihydroorotate dehydrogenase